MKVPKACCYGAVPVWRKLGYAVGSMPYAMCLSVVSVYFNIFLLEVAVIDPVYVLVILLIGHLWEIFVNPMVGYLVSLTKTRFGRLRPWLILSIGPAALCYFLLWYVPPLDHKPQYVMVIYFLIVYLALMFLLIGINVSYGSLIMHMSEDYKERDSITFYRVFFEQIGTLLSVLVFTAFYMGLVQFSSSSMLSCEVKDIYTLRATFRWYGLTIALFSILCIIVTFFTVKEQEKEIKLDKHVGIIRGLKDTFGFRPFFYAMMINLFGWLSIQFPIGNVALYLKYSVKMERQYPYVIAVFMVNVIVTSVAWNYVMKWYGKKTALYLGIAVFLPAIWVLLFLDYFYWGAYVVAVFLSIGVSCITLVTWSMLPDVIEESLLTQGVRREELFYAFYVTVNKLTAGFTLVVSAGVYKIAGYDRVECEQPWTVALALKLLMTVPPFLFGALVLVFLYCYPITEHRREQTRHSLAKRRNGEEFNNLTKSKDLKAASPSCSDTDEISADERTLLAEDSFTS